MGVRWRLRTVTCLARLLRRSLRRMEARQLELLEGRVSREAARIRARLDRTPTLTALARELGTTPETLWGRLEDLLAQEPS